MSYQADSARKGLAKGLTEYGDPEFSLFLRRSFAKSMGFSAEDYDKPVIGILNTFSEFNNCHRSLRELAESVKRGVWQSGGLPLEFPTISLGEIFLNPSSMMMRNLMSMDAEVMLGSQPMDGAVLLGGCDKTMPALLMGAASAGIPAIAVVAGPMLTGSFKGERLGACTDCRRYWAAYRRQEIDRPIVDQVEGQLSITSGTCAVMGTASTMACLTEALGMSLPGSASIPAVYSDRLRNAEDSGKQIMKAIELGLTPQKIMTEQAFLNALRVLLAIGGSTNAIIHLTAIAGRLGIRLDLDALNGMSDETPVLVDLKPSGEHYMEDFHRAGGLPVVLNELKTMLDLDAVSINGQTLGQNLDGVEYPDWQSVIRETREPLQPQGALAVLRGSLCPDGAIIKRSAASKELLKVKGRAVVFENLQDLHQRIDDPDLDVEPNDILVLKNAGPVGAPGMPEAGYLPIPGKLEGVKDIVRISDARMSGTAFGTIVVHVSPEAAVGGPLALVQNGDIIDMDVEKRKLDLLLDDAEWKRRRDDLKLNPPVATRGYEWLYRQHVEQVHFGADFDFMRHESLQE